jgi:hypothetical protein
MSSSTKKDADCPGCEIDLGDVAHVTPTPVGNGSGGTKGDDPWSRVGRGILLVGVIIVAVTAGRAFYKWVAK